MSSGLRECVHEFGLPIVTACLQFGVRNPAHIRQLVREVWAGARQHGQRSGVVGTLDWLLIQAGVPISGAGLRRLIGNSMVIVPIDPTRAMIDASLSEVSGFNVRVTKEEKHRRRLKAALETARPK